MFLIYKPFSAKIIKAKRVFIKENGPFHQDRPHLYKSPAARAAGNFFDIYMPFSAKLLMQNAFSLMKMAIFFKIAPTYSLCR